MGQKVLGLLSGLAFASSVCGQECQTTTLQSTVPSDDHHVALASYSYCGGSLNVTSYISNDDYDKIVTLYYSNVAGDSTPLTSVGLNYQSSIDGTNWELWNSVTPIYQEGIQRLLNITYQATDIGQTFNQQLDLAVNASGAPAPTLPSPPRPYATPKGFGKDITDFLAVRNGSQTETALARMFLNINPAVEGATTAVVVAGRSGPTFDSHVTDYEYNWVRDSSLTMDVVQSLYSAATHPGPKSQYEDVLFEYAQARANEQTAPNLQTGLGEPKFYLNNTVYTGPWGRPQNDGPATAAITLIEFANSYLETGGSLETVREHLYDSSSYPAAPIQNDLLFVAKNWSSPSFDLWEEESSDHFYTRMVQRRSLVMGAAFARRMNDSVTASTLDEANTALTATMSQFWDEGRQIVLYEYGPVLRGKSSYLDVSVVLGLIHGYAGDGVYSYTNDQIQSTVVRLATSFLDIYAIANQSQTDSSGAVLGIPIGRYPEDVYSGSISIGGNPWYLTTAALAQYMWTSSLEYNAAGAVSVTNRSMAFFDYFVPEANLTVGESYKNGSAQYSDVINSLNGWGDAFMRTVKYYTPANGHLTEEYNRTNGEPEGCVDLTWSYASILTAALSRASLRGRSGYATHLANLGFASNKLASTS